MLCEEDDKTPKYHTRQRKAQKDGVFDSIYKELWDASSHLRSAISGAEYWGGSAMPGMDGSKKNSMIVREIERVDKVLSECINNFESIKCDLVYNAEYREKVKKQKCNVVMVGEPTTEVLITYKELFKELDIEFVDTCSTRNSKAEGDDILMTAEQNADLVIINLDECGISSMFRVGRIVQNNTPIVFLCDETSYKNPTYSSIIRQCVDRKLWVRYNTTLEGVRRSLISFINGDS